MYGRPAAADNKIISYYGNTPDIQHSDVHGLFGLGRLDGKLRYNLRIIDQKAIPP
jgi:hypothetical protein